MAYLLNRIIETKINNIGYWCLCLYIFIKKYPVCVRNPTMIEPNSGFDIWIKSVGQKALLPGFYLKKSKYTKKQTITMQAVICYSKCSEEYIEL